MWLRWWGPGVGTGGPTSFLNCVHGWGYGGGGGEMLCTSFPKSSASHRTYREGKDVFGFSEQNLDSVQKRHFTQNRAQLCVPKL